MPSIHGDTNAGNDTADDEANRNVADRCAQHKDQNQRKAHLDCDSSIPIILAWFITWLSRLNAIS